MKKYKLQIYCSNRELQLRFWLFHYLRSFDKFEFQNIKTLARLLGPQMILNEKLINYKVVVLMEIYNFGFGRFSIRDCLKKLVFLNFKTSYTNLRLYIISNEIVVNYKVVDLMVLVVFHLGSFIQFEKIEFQNLSASKRILGP